MGQATGDLVEISVTPSVVVPIIGCNNNIYKVRTMLDSGSESNWVSKDILPFIKFSKISTIRLNVKHFNGSTPQKFDLVQVYIAKQFQDAGRSECESVSVSGELECVDETINCLVYNGFFYHKIVPGLKEFVKENGALSKRV